MLMREASVASLEDAPTTSSGKETSNLDIATDPLAVWPQQFCISGYNERKNHVLYLPARSAEAQETIVYFGGDIQDFHENMQRDREHCDYIEWCLENTARILQRQFRNCNVVIIRPLRMEFQTFSCFDNFVPCGKYGIPTHTPMHNALDHLAAILENLSTIQRKKYKLIAKDKKSDVSISDNSTATPSFDLLQHGLKIVGFSKGCTVLNQLIHEFHYLKTSNTSVDQSILKKIKDLYWLDGGHAGKTNTWITCPQLLQTLSNLDINIHIHVTPYQINDEHRPWLKEEEQCFFETLQTFNSAHVRRVIHYPDRPRSLDLHFQILTVFSQKEFD